MTAKYVAFIQKGFRFLQRNDGCPYGGRIDPGCAGAKLTVAYRYIQQYRIADDVTVRTFVVIKLQTDVVGAGYIHDGI